MASELVKHANIANVNENLVLTCKLNKLDMEHTNTWYIDTRYRNHMSEKKEFFSHLDESISREVNFRNKSKIFVMGKGNIIIQSKDGITITIVDVYFMPRHFLEFIEY